MYKNMLYAFYYKEVRARYIRKNMKIVKYKGDKLRIMLDKMQRDRVKNVYVKMVELKMNECREKNILRQFDNED